MRPPDLTTALPPLHAPTAALLRPSVAARPIHRNKPDLRLRARFLVAERRLSGIRNLDPLLVGRRAFDVAVVPVPPLVGRGLRIALGRVLPDLLPAERRDVEVVPGTSHLL